MLLSGDPASIDSLLSGTQALFSPNTYQPTFATDPSLSQPNSFPLASGSSTSSPVSFSPSGYNLSSITSQASPPKTPPDYEDPLLQLFYPGWDSTLPSPALVSKLVDVYFSRPHVASGMINQPRFLASLALPPTHALFPPSCLLHAMLATASRFVSDDAFALADEASFGTYWRRAEPGVHTPADYHAARAKEGIQAAIRTGHRLLQTTQATILCCLDSYTSARFVEVWLLTGMATRMVTPLGLNHLRSVPADDAGVAFLKPDMIPVTSDDEELRERAATCWMAVAFDGFASASTGWAASIDNDDITTLLPPASGPYPTEDLIHSPLSQHNPSCLESHPPHLVAPLQLFFKSVILLRRVLVLIARSPAPIGKGLPLSSLYSGFDVRTTAPFKRLDQEAETFRLSIPREYRSPAAEAKDPRLVLAYSLAHTSTILLHESMATAEPDCVSMAKTVNSARAILSAMYDLLGTAYSPTQLPPFITYCWIIAGRTLVRDYALRQVSNKFEGVVSLKEDIRNLVAAMRATRTPCAETSARALEALFRNPELCLPVKHTGAFGPNLGVECCGGPDEVFSQARKEGGFAGAAVLRIGDPAVGVVTPPVYPANGTDFTRVVDGYKESGPWGSPLALSAGELEALLAAGVSPDPNPNPNSNPNGVEVGMRVASGGKAISPLDEVAEENRFQDLGGLGGRTDGTWVQ